MADLRDSFDVNETLGVAPTIIDQARANGMGQLRRGFEAGLIGQDANAMGADEATLRANGDVAGADALRANIGAAQRRQAVFAPRVGRVEDIGGIGDGADWAAGQVGQGAASMMAPVGAATGLGAVGRVGRLIPGALGRGIGAAADLAAPAAAFGINQRQMKGEFYNDAVQDPELMRRTSAVDLNRASELQGVLGGALDTALPHIVGKQLTGAGLRKGISSLGPVAKTGLGMTGEGLTEAAQSGLSQGVQGYLNPNRDTSGDTSELVNAFAGGAVGAGPFVAAGNAADAGYRRVGDTAERLGTKAGETVDMAKDAAAPLIEKGRGWIGRGKSALGQVIDLAKDAEANFDAQKAVDSIKTGAQDLVSRYKVSRDEQTVLNQDMPAEAQGDPEAQAAWIAENDGKRGQLVADRLSAMAEADPQAATLLDQLAQAGESGDVAAQQAAVDAGAAHVLQNNEMEQLVSRAERAAAVAGEVGAKAGKAIGAGAAAAGKGAMKFGKAVFDGAKAGASKKNEQANESLEEFEARMSTAADIAESAATQAVQGTRFAKSAAPALVRQAVMKISTVAPAFKEKSLSPGGKLSLNTMADTLRVGLGTNAATTLAEMQAVSPKETHPLFEYLRKEVAASATPAGRKARAELRMNAANELMALLPAARRNVIMKMEATPRSDGSPSGMSREWLIDTVEAAADGHVTRAERADLEALFGGNWQKAVEAVNAATPERVEPKVKLIDDGGAQGEASVTEDGEYEPDARIDDFEADQADKKVAKGAGPKTYGFAKTTTFRGSNERRDPFSPLSKMSDADRTAFENENRQRAAEGLEPLVGTPVKRPNLFKKDDKLFVGGANALEKKVADMEKSLGVTADNASYAVSARSARDVMGELGYGLAKQLSLYRDYLRQDAAAKDLSPAERADLTAKANTVNKAVMDAMDQSAASFRLTAGMRRKVAAAANAYFDERFLVVGEQLSDRDPTQIAAPELLELGRAGDKAVNFAKDDNAALDAQNILTFKSDVMPRKGENRDLHISANSLVGWVRKQRAQGQTGTEETSRSPGAKNEAFLADLMEGISVVLGSGLVDSALPTKVNARGQAESFAKGIPPSLRLVSATYGGVQFGKEKKLEGVTAKPLLAERDPKADARNDDDHQQAVGEEQDRDFFTADPLEGTATEPVVARAPGAQMTDAEAKQLRALKTPADRAAFVENLGLRKNGERFSDAAAENAKSSGDAATPLDFFPKLKKGAQPDEFADQQFRSKTTGADTSAVAGPETKLDAPRKAAARGDALVAQMARDFPTGITALNRRLRTAERPSYSADKTQAVGGTHYVWPAAVALNADAIAGLDLGPVQARQVVDARAKTAGIILNASDLTDAQKVQLTRLMAPAASAERINLMNYRGVLEKASAAAPEVAAQALPKAPSLPSGAAETAQTQNAQDARDGNSATASQADMQAAANYVQKVLGPKVKLTFEEITGYSGEWIDADQAIKISTTAAAGVMQTAYHEALHGFFSKWVKGDARALEVMKSLAENEAVLNRVNALLARFPKAQAQLTSGEERLAYIYQFWAAGLLDLGPGKGRSLLQKVAKFFRRVLGSVKDSERAVELFEAFHAGALANPSVAGKVIQGIIQQGDMSVRARRKLDGLLQLAAAGVVPSETILLKSASPRAQLLAREMFSNPGDAAAAEFGEGYLNARRNESMRYKNLFAQSINGLSDRDLKDVAGYLQSATEPADIPYAPHAAAVKGIRAALDRFYDYMKERGVDVGYIEKYYPVTWSVANLVENRQGFVDMLNTHYASVLDQGVAGSKQKGMSRDDVALRIWRSLVDKQGGDNKVDPNREDGVLVPFFESGEGRVLDWIAPEHREPFLEKDLIGQMSRYFHQGARAAEYTARFGQDGELLDGALREIANELVVESKAMAKRNEFGGDDAARAKWVQRQVRDVHHAVGAMEGSLGKEISPTLRKFNSYMTVYQNVRLLPLSLFSSVVDPLAIIARGGEMKEAYEAFLSGMQEVFRTWGNAFRDQPKAKQRSEWEELAEMVGATDSEIFSHFVADEYASGYLAPTAKKINDKMFVLNGMEAWNRSMRISATKSAVLFIQKHKSLPTEHSARWLTELGLTPSSIALDADGRLITSRHVLAAEKGISLAQATEDIRAIHFAVNRWVEGAVLTPNAAQRPSWSSDPRFSVFFHLKQFAYSFHQTVLKRAVKELEYGNLAPMGVFAWYIPTMIAADITKGLMVGGGELPNYMKAYNAGDWVMHGVQRAGLLGVGTIGTDAASDLSSLGGPAIEQAIDALTDPLRDSTIRALPLHGLYREALK